MKRVMFFLSAGIAWASLTWAGVIKVDYHAEFEPFGGFPAGAQVHGTYYFDEEVEPRRMGPHPQAYPMLQYKANIGGIAVADPAAFILVHNDIAHPPPSNLLRDRYQCSGTTSALFTDDILLMSFGVSAEEDAAFNNDALMNEELPTTAEDLSGFPTITAYVTFQNLTDGGLYAVHALTSLTFNPINTPPGTDTIVTSESLDEWGDPAPFAPAVSIAFAEVFEGGNTSCTVMEHGPPPPPGFYLGEPALYLAIESDAVYSNVLSVCVDYSSLDFLSHDEDLLLAQYTEEGWVDITEANATNLSILRGTTSRLTLFTILEPAPDPLTLLNALQDQLADLSLSRGVYRPLQVQLLRAMDQLEHPRGKQKRPSESPLKTFIKKVEQNTPRKISVADAQMLIDRAHEIIMAQGMTRPVDPQRQHPSRRQPHPR